ncbi:MAG: FHA domain-containing protein [Pirellulaceae bacterium]|nr:FHA domain-containing protein [Pirellulaceae bacterium]
MEPTSTVSDRSTSKNRAASSIVGQLEALDSVGLVYQNWNVVQPRCTIGSNAESSICIDDSSLASVHALVIFGKNHTLIRAMGGQVRISGRSVREWLIDEPTMIQCGATRLVVYPAGHLSSERTTGHRVTPGNIVDQASRIRNPQTQDVGQSLTLDGPVENTRNIESSSVDTTAALSASVAQDLLPKPEPIDVNAVMEPLQRAVQEASDGINELSRRAIESVTELDKIPVINQNIVEVTQAIENLDGRMSTITQYCESLIANVSESIEGRLSRLDDVLARLIENPSLFETRTIATKESVEPALNSMDQDTHRQDTFAENLFGENPFANDSHTSNLFANDSFAETAYREEPVIEHAETRDETSQNAFEYPANDDVPTGYRAHEAVSIPSASESTLPAWFTESDSNASEDAIESNDVPAVESSWSAAQLNPLYAEDTNAWLESIDDAVELPQHEVPSGFTREGDASEHLDIDDHLLRISDASFQEPEATFIRDEVPIGDSSESTFDETPSCEEVRYEAPEVEAPQAVEQEEGREESIEDYMARLLQRVKWTPDSEVLTSGPATASSKSRETTPAPVSSTTIPTTTENSSSITPENGLDSSSGDQYAEHQPGEFTRRKAAPENSKNLAALRTLANDTARQAIQNSSRKKIELVFLGKLSVSALGIGGALLLLVLNGFHANVTMIGMIASFVVGMLWGYEAVTQFSLLKAVKAKEASEIANA